LKESQKKHQENHDSGWSLALAGHEEKAKNSVGTTVRKCRTQG
jgi:hypothetical protein